MKPLYIILFLSIAVGINAQDLTWTGAGDGTSWEDPDNWDFGRIPTATDHIEIRNEAIVSITTNAVAKRVDIRQDASLMITTMGQLSLPTNANNDILRLRNRATLINDGTISITGISADQHPIHIINLASLTNKGTIVISQTARDGIKIENNGSLINSVNASISILFSDSGAVEMLNSATFTNYGSFSAVNFKLEGLDMDDFADCYNYGTMNFDTSLGGFNAIDMAGSGTQFANFGTIDIVDIFDGGEGIELGIGSSFFNLSTGVINMINVTGDALYIWDYGYFENSGAVSIIANPQTTEDNTVEIECNSRLNNFGLMAITNNGNSDAIALKCSGSFFNGECGELNILTNNIIEVLEVESLFINRHLITTASTIVNVNNGVFTNTGVINATPAFTTAPNPVAEGPDVPTPWLSSSIGSSGSLGNDFAFLYCNLEFVVTGGGNNAFPGGTSDNVAYVSQHLCGDNMSITAKIESISAGGYGGLMIREALSAGSKQVSIFSNLTNMVRHETRYTLDGIKQVNQFFRPNPIWLRLERQGSWIFAYYSQNGMPNTFQYVHAVFVPMNNCVEVGLASFTYNPAQQATAVFSNVSALEGVAPNVEVPTSPEVENAISLKTAVNVYPNPALDMVNIEFAKGLDISTSVVLRNTMGQMLEQRQLNEGDITSAWDISTLANGMYFFEIHQQGADVQMLKFIKN